MPLFNYFINRIIALRYLFAILYVSLSLAFSLLSSDLFFPLPFPSALYLPFSLILGLFHLFSGTPLPIFLL